MGCAGVWDWVRLGWGSGWGCGRLGMGREKDAGWAGCGCDDWACEVEG